MKGKIANTVIKEFAKTLPDEIIQCVIIDPPYGVNFKDDHYNDSYEYVKTYRKQWLREIWRVMKDGGHIYIFVPTLYIDEWIKDVRDYFTFKNLIATQKYLNNNFREKNNFTYDAQYIIFAHKSKGKPFNKVDWIPTSRDWFYDSRNESPQPYTYLYPSFLRPDMVRANPKMNKIRKRLHPNQKSVKLIQKFIEISTDKDDIVADFFMGSGSTAIAAMKCKRMYVGCEPNEDYYNLTMKRVKTFVSTHDTNIINFFKKN